MFNNGDSHYGKQKTTEFDMTHLVNLKTLKFSNENDKFNQIVTVFNKSLLLPQNIEELFLPINFNNGDSKGFDVKNAKLIYFPRRSIFNKKLLFSRYIKKVRFGKKFENGKAEKLDFRGTELESIEFQINSPFNKQLLLPESTSEIQIGIYFNNGDSTLFDISHTKIKSIDFEPIKTMFKKKKNITNMKIIMM